MQIHLGIQIDVLTLSGFNPMATYSQSHEFYGLCGTVGDLENYLVE